MKKNSIHDSEKIKEFIAALIMAAVIVISCIAIVYGNLRNQIEDLAVYNSEYGLSYYYDMQNINAATAALELAHAYYNAGDYENAAIHFEAGIPIVYEWLDWDIDDTAGPETLAIAYKVAADTYGKLGNQKMKQHYEREYEDIVWIRQISEDELMKLMKDFHWGM